MSESRPGASSSGGAHRGRGAPGLPASYRRSFRCRAAVKPAADPLMHRYDDFVALHDALAEPPRISLRRLWLCGAALAAAAAGLASLTAYLLRSLFDAQMPVFVAASAGAGEAATAYGVCAGAATLQATALLHVLIGTAARPVRAFGWIGAIVVGLVTLLPLTVRAPADAIAGTASFNLAGGIMIVGSLTTLAAASREWGRDWSRDWSRDWDRPRPRTRRRRRRR
ncbi:hypothetical protein [Actinomadura flavalba]|uniref:hypothetical protein n=1 Tax=Actinomadura flavalba TaxID=1120938 RepID=UPI0003660981|nr:hypothetical protein [Actinomadura flavalba]